MKKILFLLFLAPTAYASEIILSWNKSAQTHLPAWKRVEQQIKNNAVPLQQKVTETVGNYCIYTLVRSETTSSSWNCSGLDFTLYAYLSGEKNHPLSFNIGIQGTSAFIKNIMVEPAYQNKGLGSACIKVFDEPSLAKLLRYKTIHLNSVATARGFYKKLGFTCPHEDARDRAYYLYSKHITFDNAAQLNPSECLIS